MCRNIRTLFNFEPPASELEIRDASLQFVRKLSGFNVPSKANEAAFERAVEDVAATARSLIGTLVTNAPPRDRAIEAAKARRALAGALRVSSRPAMPRVTLRTLGAADEAAFVAAAQASTRLHAPWVTAPVDTEAFARYLARFDGVAHVGFVVEHATTGNLVGAINLTHIVRGAFCSGYLGYFAFAGFERQGLMREGLHALVRRAFNAMKLHRLEANIQPGNAASIALVRACGFSREGYSPAYLKIGGRWRDHERWALVRGREQAPPAAGALAT